MQIDESTIVAISPEALMSQDLFCSVTEIEEPEERARMTALLEIRSKELGLQTQFRKVMKAYADTERSLAAEFTQKSRDKKTGIHLEYDAKGLPLPSIDNFVQIISNDSRFAGIKYNLLTDRPEVEENGTIRSWTDADDSEARRYIEKAYHIHSKDKSDDAFRILFRQREYHPVRDIVRSIQWDGKNRVEHFLHTWTHCDDTPYTREVSRLIFAGLVNRTFRPGCKFDDMVVLVGKQGCGKSTLVRWLALDDKYFGEINDFEGQPAMEALDGCVVAEVSELLALTRQKEQEAVKSFLTRLNDRRRNPYDRRVTDHPRQCVFLGTSNKANFIRDATGGRRFYPITVRQDGYSLFDREDECREYIRQCWAEAYARMQAGDMPAYADRRLIVDIRQKQAEAAEEDYRLGMIQGYLDGKSATCILDLWRNALGNGEMSKPTPKDSTEIGLIMQSMEGWEKQPRTRRFGVYGPQRWWMNSGNLTEEGDLL